ncbi:MAG: two pore domain potassium channel family protein, partial [Burkholderiales bacterium]|nr:two pore domain potassium channel family protein [Burkholderiales bacterium]
GFNAFYFSFVTLSTVGYGDFVPVSPVARTLAMTEAMTGTLYLAILISRLVSLHSSAGHPAKRD